MNAYQLLAGDTPVDMENARLEFDIGRIDIGDRLIAKVNVTVDNNVTLHLYARPEDTRKAGVYFIFEAGELRQLKEIVEKAERLFQRAGAW